MIDNAPNKSRQQKTTCREITIVNQALDRGFNNAQVQRVHWVNDCHAARVKVG